MNTNAPGLRGRTRRWESLSRTHPWQARCSRFGERLGVAPCLASPDMVAIVGAPGSVLGGCAHPRVLSPQQPNDAPNPDQTAASVMTDRSDYAAGATAVIFGSGFAAGETISLHVLHADDTPATGAEHQPWTVKADTLGNYVTTWYVCEDDCVGSHLALTAIGQSSGQTTQAIFTDSAPGPKRFLYPGATRRWQQMGHRGSEVVNRVILFAPEWRMYLVKPAQVGRQ